MQQAVPLIDEDKHHPALNLIANIQTNLKQNNAPKYIFRNADYQSLNRFFVSCSWIDLYKLHSIDDKVNWFYDKINEGIAQYVPLHYRKISNYPNWFSKELINKINEKKAAHANYKKFNSKYYYKIFHNLRNICKTLSSDCYNAHITKTELLIKSDASNFWSYLKNKRRSNNEMEWHYS